MGKQYLNGIVYGGAGQVVDVQVDGVSVVTNGVAEIDLTDYAQISDLGTASAKDYTSSVTQGSTDLVTSGAVFNAIDNLPEPMVFKGTLGTGGTITSLPTASASNEGYTYKVITAGTYAGQVAKVGDVFVSNGSEWVLIPSGDTDSDTWRSINVNGTQAIGSAISTGAVNFKNGTNVTISVSGNDITISAQDTTYSDATQSTHGLMSTTDKTKLDGIAVGAEVNVQSDWSQSDSTADDFIKNKPTIPTVNDGTLTITQNGTSKGTFTANQSTNSTIALTDTTGYINQNETVVSTDKVPYVMRTSKTIANATPYIREMLVGGSIGWNQMIQNGNFESATGWSGRYATVSVNSNVATLTPSSAGTLRGLTAAVGYGINIVVSHKYLLYCYVKPPINVTASCDFETVSRSVSLTANTWNFVPNIVNATTSANIRFYCLVNESLTTSQAVLYKNVNVIDLTLMLGTTIADYIYGLETATTGAGIAKLRELGFFTKTYYPYNAGSVLSVQTTGHKITDANNENTVTYNVDDVVLRGVPKLDTNNNLYYDGDIYESNGAVTVKYSPINLGTLEWTYDSGSSQFYASMPSNARAVVANGGKGVCAKYTVVNASSLSNKSITYCNSSFGNSKTVYVKDSAYSDATTFTSAMDGIILVYELATPSDTTWQPFQNPQYVYPGGTEEYIDTREVPVPVGHITEYMGSSAEKFYLPPLPIDDAEYVLSVKNGIILWKRVTEE